MAQVMRGSLGGGIQARDGVAGFAGELHAAHGHEADGEAVHAVADAGARAVGAQDIAGEVIVAGARAAALVPPAEAALTLGSHLR